MTNPLPDLVQTFKALAHPARLRILAMLRPGELCGCQVAALLALSPSTVSAHLAELRRGGLIVERREGRWVHYRLSDRPGTGRLLQQVWSKLGADPTVRGDAAVARQLRAVDLSQLGITRPDLRTTGATK
jgi:arsenate reductase/ArsR family transcriptional regulator